MVDVRCPFCGIDLVQGPRDMLPRISDKTRSVRCGCCSQVLSFQIVCHLPVLFLEASR
jgi:hypothetical protein